MNQQILINDDFHFSEFHKAWVFTAINSGSLITFVVKKSAELKEITQATKFDWEERAEEWLEENELDDECVIHI
ncbi:hypothetical protein [Thalassotalea profundi]|uniref:Uncharacterized protein n=1 Tax=Thalassotalea profundi TaxID=2036687 RepID=A0ABQ3IXY2_9GAMM|nr:hypothetical protein [Thalassotalea profundi]GHE96497.1 hypothetical protein GCM10011501_27730 [Thalassotalea profundi]